MLLMLFLANWLDNNLGPNFFSTSICTSYEYQIMIQFRIHFIFFAFYFSYEKNSIGN